MKRSKKAMLAAGLIAGAAALTGCTANTTPVATPTPQAEQKQTAQPAATAEASASPEAGGEESPVPIRLTVDGDTLEKEAVREQDMLLLPLVETAEALGWKAESEKIEEETQVKRSVVLTKDDSRIAVTWTVSDNTARQVTWQKDGLLIPVDTRITPISDVVYVPAAFFEEAMDVKIASDTDRVSVSTPEPKETPEMQEPSPEA